MKLRVLYSPFAWAQFEALSDNQQEQARRLLAGILLGGRGREWARDGKGRMQRIVSASDTHVIFRITFIKSRDTVYVTAVLVYPTPPDPNNRD